MEPGAQSDAAPFVFIIGYNKTATTSLHEFFARNGFPAVHWDKGRLAVTMLSNVCNGKRALDGYDGQFRVFSDMTFRTSRFKFEANTIFRTLDADYPGALFLYNYRDVEGWLESRAAHPSRIEGETLLQFEMRLMRTNDAQLVFAKWRSERAHLEAELRQHFAGRSTYLELDIFDDAVPEKLSAFVGRPMSPAHWQQHNKTPQG